jgi:hypothetical protein
MEWNRLPFATRVWIAHRALNVSRRQHSGDFILAQAIAACIGRGTDAPAPTHRNGATPNELTAAARWLEMEPG